MLILQLGISTITIVAFWLVTHLRFYRLGLFVGLMSEACWIFYLSLTKQWGLVIVPVIMLWVIIHRIFNTQK